MITRGKNVKRTYKRVTFQCTSYEEMMNVYYSNYVDEYQLIGYQLTNIDFENKKAVLILYKYKKRG